MTLNISSSRWRFYIKNEGYNKAKNNKLIFNNGTFRAFKIFIIELPIPPNLECQFTNLMGEYE